MHPPLFLKSALARAAATLWCVYRSWRDGIVRAFRWSAMNLVPDQRKGHAKL